MAKAHKYYLAIDEKIVDFSLWSEFPDMTDFLTLALFTQMFKDEKSLLDALVKLGFVNNNLENPCISIVKSTLRGYVSISNDVLLKRDAKFLSSNNVIDFLYNNRKNFSALVSLFRGYLREIEELIELFRKKIDYLNDRLDGSKGEVKVQLLKEIESRKNSLRNFNLNHANVSNILNCLEIMRKNHDFHDEVVIEYMALLQRFVTYETMYIRGTKISPNFRGMVKLAIKIGSLGQRYGMSMDSFQDYSFSRKKINIESSYRMALANRLNSRALPVETVADDSDENDPDVFMFLETIDFDRMIKPDSSIEFKTSVEADIESFNEKMIGYKVL